MKLPKTLSVKVLKLAGLPKYPLKRVPVQIHFSDPFHRSAFHRVIGFALPP